ncbi:DUF1217 domain-containing protein [Falsirhodobacter algicola]|uniref:DUF1217 domain-containing protein n=1 Tax=Falsirhodobacter algicola TaxID=2692330 RepID=A0A8J8SKX7_9RHOB|nr:DUF1217 domain-containing protein [Falsirhodobacter algicola]QUS35937.1 DUF1217 domain-containing protein [Falsirhodobacter algicola]
MSFTPVLPMSGYGGWAFLQRTLPAQKAAFEGSATVQRSEDYFREKIGSITTGAELVADRRLLEVALGAFGLDDDINNKYFIRKVLDSDLGDDSSLANRLSDDRYAAMAKAFGFGGTAATGEAGFADQILSRYVDKQFMIAVGDQDVTLRVAMNAQVDLPELAASGGSENTMWYSVLGSEPLRELFQTAFGLPDSFASIDLDQQLSVLKERSRGLTGSTSPAAYADPEVFDKLLRRFLAMAQLQDGVSSTSPGATALSLLSGSGSASSILSIIV